MAFTTLTWRGAWSTENVEDHGFETNCLFLTEVLYCINTWYFIFTSGMLQHQRIKRTYTQRETPSHPHPHPSTHHLPQPSTLTPDTINRTIHPPTHPPTHARPTHKDKTEEKQKKENVGLEPTPWLSRVESSTADATRRVVISCCTRGATF